MPSPTRYPSRARPGSPWPWPDPGRRPIRRISGGGESRRSGLVSASGSGRGAPGSWRAVVGGDPADGLRAAWGAAGVQVPGTVADVGPHVAEAAVSVVPLRIGGGTRLKIFEALAMGKAVVSTRVGAEGLPIVSGQHFLQADSPADFAQAVVTLLKDPDRRHALGLAGRRLAEDRHSSPQATRH